MVLAIDSALRGKGYGTKTLNLFKEAAEGKPLFFVVESLDEDAINYEQRVSRVRFYERLGFKFYDMKLNLISGSMDVMGPDGLNHDLILNEFETIFSRLVDFVVINKDFVLDCFKKDNFDLEVIEGLLKYYENNEFSMDVF